jgi:hypothetical protein
MYGSPLVLLLSNGSVHVPIAINACRNKIFVSFPVRFASYQRKFYGSRLGKEQLLKASFSMRYESYQRKIGEWLVPELVAYLYALNEMCTNKQEVPGRTNSSCIKGRLAISSSQNLLLVCTHCVQYRESHILGSAVYRVAGPSCRSPRQYTR